MTVAKTSDSSSKLGSSAIFFFPSTGVFPGEEESVKKLKDLICLSKKLILMTCLFVFKSYLTGGGGGVNNENRYYVTKTKPNAGESHSVPLIPSKQPGNWFGLNLDQFYDDLFFAKLKTCGLVM